MDRAGDNVLLSLKVLASVAERVTGGGGCCSCCCGGLPVTDEKTMDGCMLFVGLGVRDVGVGSGSPYLATRTSETKLGGHLTWHLAEHVGWYLTRYRDGGTKPGYRLGTRSRQNTTVYERGLDLWLRRHYGAGPGGGMIGILWGRRDGGGWRYNVFFVTKSGTGSGSGRHGFA